MIVIMIYYILGSRNLKFIGSMCTQWLIHVHFFNKTKFSTGFRRKMILNCFEIWVFWYGNQALNGIWSNNGRIWCVFMTFMANEHHMDHKTHHKIINHIIWIIMNIIWIIINTIWIINHIIWIIKHIIWIIINIIWIIINIIWI